MAENISNFKSAGSVRLTANTTVQKKETVGKESLSRLDKGDGFISRSKQFSNAALNYGHRIKHGQSLNEVHKKIDNYSKLNHLENTEAEPVALIEGQSPIKLSPRGRKKPEEPKIPQELKDLHRRAGDKLEINTEDRSFRLGTLQGYY